MCVAMIYLIQCNQRLYLAQLRDNVFINLVDMATGEIACGGRKDAILVDEI